MSTMTPAEMAKFISGGLLSFPVTHFRADLTFDESGYRDHCDWLLQHSIAGLFAAGGTGEFFALTPGEVDLVCRAAVAATRGHCQAALECALLDLLGQHLSVPMCALAG
jgi:5-dehydro-4-deoxyglucarate dehydratase